MTSVEQNPRVNLVLVKDMNPMNRNFDCEVIVLQKESEPNRTREGDLISRFIVADRTASIVLSVWGEQGADIRNGDILRITGVDNKLRKGHLQLSTSKTCKIRRVGQDTFPFVEKPNMSEVEYPSNTINTNNWSKNQPQIQQDRIPVNINNNNSNNNNNNNNSRIIRGYSSSVNAHNMNHPYRNRPQHLRGGFHNNNNNNNRSRGGGSFNNNNNNNNNRYHRDLDNPV
jgi:hypothetical protein